MAMQNGDHGCLMFWVEVRFQERYEDGQREDGKHGWNGDKGEVQKKSG